MSKSILIVDDESDIRELLQSYLKGQGFLVEVAADGQEALDLLKTKPFDFVITDMRLPGLTGDKLLTESKKMGLPSKFIIISGASPSEYSAEKIIQIKAQADGFLNKPFDRKSLLALLK